MYLYVCMYNMCMRDFFTDVAKGIPALLITSRDQMSNYTGCNQPHKHTHNHSPLGSFFTLLFTCLWNGFGDQTVSCIFLFIFSFQSLVCVLQTAGGVCCGFLCQYIYIITNSLVHTHIVYACACVCVCVCVCVEPERLIKKHFPCN